MKKIGSWLKRWSFLIIVVIMGIIYFSRNNGWQVYTRPFEQVFHIFVKEPIPTDTKDYLAEEGSTLEETNTSEEISISISAEDVSGGDLEGNQAGLSIQELPQTPSGEVQYVTAEDDYFQDAVFIGDSRTVGMYEYGALEEVATFYASTGLTVYKLFDAPIVEVQGQKQKKTIEEALSEQRFSKIYLMIGINEMGMGTVESFMETYKEAVTHLQELQPDAIIYLQAIMKVTTKRSNQGDYITNEGIEARNEEIAKLADNQKIFYLDVNPLICDEAGGMESSYTYDGVHLKAQYISIWKDYLKAHAVEVLD